MVKVNKLSFPKTLGLLASFFVPISCSPVKEEMSSYINIPALAEESIV
jgi:hypothetical protein